MAQPSQRSEVADIEARRRRLSIYNGEKPDLDEANQPPTGFQDPVEPVDETVESMAEAAGVSHQDDEEHHNKDDTASVAPSMTSTATLGVKKKKKKKPKSKRGIVSPPPQHHLSLHSRLSRGNQRASKSTSPKAP